MIETPAQAEAVAVQVVDHAEAAKRAAEIEAATSGWEPIGAGVEIGSLESGTLARSRAGCLIRVIGPCAEETIDGGPSRNPVVVRRLGATIVVDHFTAVGTVRSAAGVSPSIPVWPCGADEVAYELELARLVDKRVERTSQPPKSAGTDGLTGVPVKRSPRKVRDEQPEQVAEPGTPKAPKAPKVPKAEIVSTMKPKGEKRTPGLEQQVAFLSAVKSERTPDANGTLFVPLAEFVADERATKPSRVWPSIWRDQRVATFAAFFSARVFARAALSSVRLASAPALPTCRPAAPMLGITRSSSLQAQLASPFSPATTGRMARACSTASR